MRPRSAICLASLVIVTVTVQALAEDVIQDYVTVQTTFLPHLRLDQTQNPYTWQIDAGDFSFNVRDVTGNAIPLQIESGAPVGSLYIKSNGSVGLGLVPNAALHILNRHTTGAEVLAKFQIDDDQSAFMSISNASTTDGVFIPKIQSRADGANASLINEAIVSSDSGTSPAIAYNAVRGAGGPLAVRPLVTYRNNNVAKVTIAANGAVFGTSFNPASSRALKHDIVDLDSQKASAALKQLTPVEFTYNDDATAEKRIGFIAEDVPDIVANKDRKSVPIMDVIALLTRVVKDQQQTIDRQQRRLEALEIKLKQ